MSAPAAAPSLPTAFARLRLAADPTLAGRLVAFVLLAVFAASHWAALLSPAPGGRALLVVLVAALTGLALAATAAIPSPTLARAARFVILLAGLALALMAAGLQARLLWSENWDDLGSGISDGLPAAGNVRPWPYAGEDAWLRLTVMLGLAPVAVLAAAAAFWPLRRGAIVARTAGLALLVALFSVAAAAAEYDAGILRGLALFALIAAWLWLPRLRAAEAAAAVIVLAAVAGLSAFATTRVASSEPWVDYRNWSWTDDTAGVTFNWQHEYGPLDWPRKGTTLLAVRSPEAHYWKAQSLDFFDGTRWTRLPFRDTRPVVGEVLQPDRRGWTERIRVTVRGLRSELIVGAGLVYDFDGDAEPAIALTDGAYRLGDALEAGDTYSVRAYVPDPSAREMRAADELFYEDWLRPFSTIGIPVRGQGQVLVEFPLRGSDPSVSPDPEVALAGTDYERVFRLARRIAAGQSTAYGIVKATERYLEREYEYAERVPQHIQPLPAFLFRDRRGYCQHFSGAMALMLRMNGIPARIASGFSPGTFDRNTGEYRVRDFDAHSWVEVWFQGIGWVPFDPTPLAAPARSQGDDAAPSAARGGAGDRVIRRDIFAGSTGDGALEEGGRGPWLWLAIAMAVGVLAGGVLFWRARRRPASPLGPDVDYLVALMRRLGFTLPPGATLLAVEERVSRVAGGPAAAYVRHLRRLRFGSDPGLGPTATDRRELRRSLAQVAGAGPLRRAWVAIWSGSFRSSP